MSDVSEVGDVPSWLQWMLPISAIGAGFLWVARVLLVPGLKAQIEDMLKEKFEEQKLEIEARHQQNREDIKRVEDQLKDSVADRKSIHQDLIEVKEDVAYLRGRAGPFKRQ